MATAKKTTKAKAPKAPKADKKTAAVTSMDAKVYTFKGEAKGSFALPEALFGRTWNADLVHQVVTSMQSNARKPIAHTKDRGEVRGGGRKPWKQKGTGRARHGSSRSPIWVGGGVAHGPRNERNFVKKINRSMRAAALAVVLSRKYRDGEVVFLDAVSMKAPKASEAKSMLAALSKVKGFEALGRRNNAALIALPGRDLAVEKSFRNFGNVEVLEARNLNPVAVLGKRMLVIVDPQVSVETIAKRLA